jgi:hypothetical protein
MPGAGQPLIAALGRYPQKRSSMSSDAIVILKADHKEIRDLFRKFQAAGEKAVKTKKRSPGRSSSCSRCTPTLRTR